jgi:hypothetical protein
VGDVSGSATVKGAAAVFADEVCVLNLKLIGTWLAAADNGDCGGLNVSFTGVYRRKP